MIREPKHRDAHLLSAWAGGVALLCLGIGLHGAGTPLLPVMESTASLERNDDTVMVEAFQPSSAADEAPAEPETKQEQDIEIPPLPEITPPLTPPEMVEITPLDEAPPMPKPVEKKPEPPKPTAVPKPTPRSDPKPSKESAATSGGSGGSSSSPSTTRQGRGYFPPPTYPAAAKRAGQGGSVRLCVTVEASGIPSAVEVVGSSGFPALDQAARDVVLRRWRFSKGEANRKDYPTITFK